MPVRVKKTAKKRPAKSVKTALSAKVAVNKKMKDHSHDPFFVKKAKEMEAALKKHGLPASLAHA